MINFIFLFDNFILSSIKIIKNKYSITFETIKTLRFWFRVIQLKKLKFLCFYN